MKAPKDYVDDGMNGRRLFQGVLIAIVLSVAMVEGAVALFNLLLETAKVMP